eukprot:6209682-Pleurochrysis_carterae.AAC.3
MLTSNTTILNVGMGSRDDRSNTLFHSKCKRVPQLALGHERMRSGGYHLIINECFLCHVRGCHIKEECLHARLKENRLLRGVIIPMVLSHPVYLAGVPIAIRAYTGGIDSCLLLCSSA